MVYGDPTVTDIACAGLNGMRMGERVLTVRRATEVNETPLHSQPVELVWLCHLYEGWDSLPLLARSM